MANSAGFLRPPLSLRPWRTDGRRNAGLGRSVTAIAVLAAALVAVAGPTTPVNAAPIPDRSPELLADIETVPPGLNAVHTPVATASAVFVGNNADDGGELLRVDRSTDAVTTVVPTTAGLNDLRPLLAFGDKVLFSAFDEATGREPWVYDDATGNTALVEDIAPLVDSSFPDQAFELNGRVFFVADDGTTGDELWTTDLTAPLGAQQVADLDAGGDDAQILYVTVVPVDASTDAAYFRARSDAHGDELRRLDTTNPSSPITTFDLDPGPDGSSITSIAATAGGATFVKATVGTATNVYRISDPDPDPANDTPTIVDGGGGGGSEVVAAGDWAWKTGLGASPDLLRAGATTDFSTVGTFGQPGSAFHAFDGGVVAFDTDGAGAWTVRVSDGTAGNTGSVTTVIGTRPTASAPAGVPGLLFAAPGPDGRELWHTDGTLAGTEQIVDLFAGQGSSSPGTFVPTDTGWYFLATDDVAGRQVFFSDGTAAGTRRITAIGTSTTKGSSPDRYAHTGGTTYFTAITHDAGQELWRHDQIDGSVARVVDLRPGASGSNPTLLTPLGDRLVFLADDGTTGEEPWITDGTAAGTMQLADTSPNDAAFFGDQLVGTVPTALIKSEEDRLWFVDVDDDVATEAGDFDDIDGATAIGDEVYLVGRGPAGTGLYRLDRDAPGVELLALGDHRQVAAVDGVLFVRVSGGSVLRIDPVGPVVSPVAGIVDATDIVATGGGLLVQEGDGEGPISVVPGGGPIGFFHVDGAGTATALALPPGDPVSSVDQLDERTVELDGVAYFTVRRGGSPGGGDLTAPVMEGDLGTAALFAVDGTTLSEVGTFGSSRLDLGALDRHVYVQVRPDPTGMMGGALAGFDPPTDSATFWRTDGTTAGTEQLFDFGDDGFADLWDGVLAGDQWYVTADDATAGLEPVIVDLTPDPPGAPTDVTAGLAGDDAVSVSWTAPVDDGGSDLVASTATATPGGATCTTTGATTCVVTGLTAGVTYTFTVVAANRSRTGPPSAASAPVTIPLPPSPPPPTEPPPTTPPTTPPPTPPTTGGPDIVSLDPARILETRVGPGLETVDGIAEGIGRVGAMEEITLPVAGRAGVADDARAAVVNVTAINPDERGFLTIFPCEERPLASSLNYPSAGAVVGNEVVAKLSGDGEICIYTFAGTDLTADVVGFVPADSDYRSLDPARLLETRIGPGLETIDGVAEGTGRVPPQGEVRLPVAGRGGVDADAAAVAINVTAINPDERGFVTIHDCTDLPLASSLNYAGAGAVVGNEVVARLSADGELCLYSFAATDLTVDVVGFFPDGAATTSLRPARLAETRVGPGLETIDGESEGIGRIPGGSEVEVQVTGRAGVPGTGVAAAILNVTAINPAERGFFTMYPCGDRPLASSLNYGGAGAVVGNEVIAKLSPTGSVCVFTFADSDLTLDLTGFVPA